MNNHGRKCKNLLGTQQLLAKKTPDSENTEITWIMITKPPGTHLLVLSQRHEQ